MLLFLTVMVGLFKFVGAALGVVFHALIAFITLPFRGVIGAMSFIGILAMVIGGGFYALDQWHSNTRREEAIQRVSANFRNREKAGPKRHGKISPGLLSAAAEACVDALLKANIAAIRDPCEHDAVLIVGKDAEAAAVHDRDAISEHPQWVRLTYRPSRLSVAPETPKACTDRNLKFDPQFGYSEDGKIECDEYPFRASNESGKESSYRFIRKDHNRVEGSVYLGLVLGCGFDRAYAENPPREKHLLVIAAPETIAISFYLCG
jgi:hypothetical protein